MCLTTTTANHTYRFLSFSLAARRTGSKQNKVEQPSLTLRIHRGRRSNSVPRVNAQEAKSHLKASKSVDTTSLDRRIDKLKVAEDVDMMAHKSPILHMMQITLNRKENMETFLCSAQEDDAAKKTDEGDGLSPQPQSSVTRGSSKTKRGAGRRVLKVQARRFKMETKAAKTLAIIVGGFICCWLPFFTIYLVRPFCKTCIQPLVFSVLFWLGYCNSALNPLIYALFSNEFRLAFKTLICKCLCTAQCGQCNDRRAAGRGGGDYSHPSR